jgi:hypothetical protein
MHFFLLLTLFSIIVVAFWSTRSKRGSYQATFRSSRPILEVGGCWVIVLLMVMIWWHTGWRDVGREGVVAYESRIRVSHSGYYLEPRHPFLFGGSEVEGAFRHPSLKARDRLQFLPIESRGKIESWDLQWSRGALPLRVDNSAINVSEDGWIAPGDEISVCVPENEEGKDRAGCLKVGYTHIRHWFSVSDVFNTSWSDAQSSNTTASHTAVATINDGLFLADLLSSHSELREGLPALGDTWTRVLHGITIVRQIVDDRRSHLGVLVDPALVVGAQLSLRRNNVDTKLPTATEKVLGEHRVGNTAMVSYGFAKQKPLRVNLSACKAISSNLMGYSTAINAFRFSVPVEWPLPPKPRQTFILTSSHNYVPLDGYNFDLPDLTRTFWTSAILTSAPNAPPVLQLTDGYQQRLLSTDNVLPVGNAHQGILLGVTEQRAAVPGWVALLALLWSAVLLLMGRIFDRVPRESLKLDVVWFLIWTCMLTILSARFVLAYRASVVPPADDIHSRVFVLPVIVAKWVLWLTPSLTWAARYLGLRFARRAYAPFGIGDHTSVRGESRLLLSKVHWLILAFLPVPFIWSLAGAFLGMRQSFLGLRINIAVHLLSVLLLIVSFNACRSVFPKWWATILTTAVLLPVLIQVAFIGDFGALLYLSYAPALLLVWWWWFTDNGARGWRQRTAELAPQLATVVLALGIVGSVGWLSGRFVIDAHVRERIRAFEGGQQSLLESDEDHPFDFGSYRRNQMQRWQMLAYAARGVHKPLGFAQAPLVKTGLSYPVALTDVAFSVFVLSENGRFTAWLIVFAISLLGMSIAAASLYFTDEWIHLSVGLVAIGSFLVLHTLYMALGNLGFVWFTGHNIPGLSLLSAGDAAEFSVCVTLVAFLIAIQNPVRLRATKLKSVRFCVAFLAGLAILGLVLVSVQMHRLNQQYSTYAADADLCDRRILDAIETRLPRPDDPPDRHPAWKLANDGKLIDTGYAPSPGPLEHTLVEEYNARPDKADPSKGLLYLDHQFVHQRWEPVVIMNRTAYRVRSPFADHNIWTHSIVAGDLPLMPTICGLGLESRFANEGCLQFSLAGQERTHYCLRPASVETPDTAQPLSNGYVCVIDQDTRLFELKREGDFIFLYPYPNAHLHVNGVQVRGKTQLNKNDIVHVSGAELDTSDAKDFIFLGQQQPIFAYTQWRNGALRRVFPARDLLPMAYALAEVADEVRPSDDLKLTLDLDLQRSIQQSIQQFATKTDPYSKDMNILTSKRIAVTVMDAFTGEVLALPSWPAIDVSDPDFEETLSHRDRREHQLILRNFNFLDHVVGSTVKPLVFAAMAAELYPSNIASLSIFNNPDSIDPTLHKCFYDNLAGIPIGAPWYCQAGVKAGDPIDSTSFLINSRDLYEGALGMSGLVLTKDDWLLAVSSSDCAKGSTRVKFENKQSCMDLRVLQGEVGITMDEIKKARGLKSKTFSGSPSIKESTFDRTLVFGGLEHTFDLQPRNGAVRYSDTIKFLPSLFPSTDTSAHWANVVPEPVAADPRTPYDLIFCTLGGGNGCRYNNIWMAQAAARIASQRRVFATLEKSASADPELLAPPLSVSPWWEEHLETPLQKVGTDGTAKRMKSLVPVPPSIHVLYKTGTLEEDQPASHKGRGGRESEALLFVVGAWSGHGFVPGRTFAGFLYMQDSKPKNDPYMRKFDAAAPIIRKLVERVADLEPPQITGSVKPSPTVPETFRRNKTSHHNKRR